MDGDNQRVGASDRMSACHSSAVTDADAVHKVLPLRRVSAVHRLDDVLIDETLTTEPKRTSAVLPGLISTPDVFDA